MAKEIDMGSITNSPGPESPNFEEARPDANTTAGSFHRKPSFFRGWRKKKATAEEDKPAPDARNIDDEEPLATNDGEKVAHIYSEDISPSKVLEVEDNTIKQFADVDYIYIRSGNRTLKFKKSPSAGQTINGPTARDGIEEVSDVESDIEVVPSLSPSEFEECPTPDTLISNSRSSSALAQENGGGLWIRKGLRKTKWIPIVIRIMNGWLIVGDKTYSLKKIKLKPNSMGTVETLGLLLYTFKVTIGMKVLTFGTLSDAERGNKLFLILHGQPHNQ